MLRAPPAGPVLTMEIAHVPHASMGAPARNAPRAWQDRRVARSVRGARIPRVTTRAPVLRGWREMAPARRVTLVIRGTPARNVIPVITGMASPAPSARGGPATPVGLTGIVTLSPVNVSVLLVIAGTSVRPSVIFAGPTDSATSLTPPNVIAMRVGRGTVVISADQGPKKMATSVRILTNVTRTTATVEILLGWLVRTTC